MIRKSPSLQCEHYFAGDRLRAEVAVHSQLFYHSKNDNLRCVLESDLAEIYASHGSGLQVDRVNLTSAVSDGAQFDPYAISAMRIYPQRSTQLKQFCIAHPVCPDSLLAYVLSSSTADSRLDDDKNKRLDRLWRTLSWIGLRFPGRSDLLTAFIHHSELITFLRALPDRKLPPIFFYRLTTISLCFLQELWVKGRYYEIFAHYSSYQIACRSFPASDYMIRALTIIGLVDRCQKLFRDVYAYVGSDRLQSATLSSMLFTELGMDYLDTEHVTKLVTAWREKSFHDNANLPVTSTSTIETSVARRPFKIIEKPILLVISADLHNHPVGRFWLPVARRICSSFRLIHIDFNPARSDHIRKSLKECSFEWHSYSDPSNDGLHQLLNEIKPSVLIDLGGHTADNRPALLNHRFAPVQATYLGFYGPNYGIECDWWILDRFIAQRVRSSYPGAEAIWELQTSSLCYDPALHNIPNLDEIHYDISASPVIGSFNHTRKLSSSTIASISSILTYIPGSLLKLRSHSFYDSAVRSFVLNRFLDHGVIASQLYLLPYATHPADAMLDFCRLHLHIDSSPVSGTTTTLDSLVMGVPVLTSPSCLYAGAISAALLENLGMGAMISPTFDDMPNIAAQLVNHYRNPSERHRLAAYVRQSPLCDKRTIPDHFQEALTSMLKLSESSIPSRG